jgi:flagellin-like protein
MVSNKKAISPVVATVLLLVVAVVAVIGFQNWFQTYQSGVTADVEKNSKTGTAVTIERLESTGNLYLKNAGAENITISSLTVDGNSVTCNINLTKGVSNVNNGANCDISGSVTLSKDASVDVVVVTPDGIFQEKEIVR